MKRTLLLITIAGLVSQPAMAADDSDIQALKRQIQELDQKVRVLERQKELDTEAAAAKAKDTPRIVIGSNGLSIGTADTNFAFQFHGFLQVDNRSFFDDGGIEGNSTFLIRRARPIFQGTLYRDFDFLFVPDFASTPQIFDAYLNYRYQPWIQLRVGKFKVPIGLEHMQSDPVTSFNERSLVTSLMPNRDVGFQLWGDVAGGRLTYMVGVFNGLGDGRSTSNVDVDDRREVAARIFVLPWKKSELPPLQNLGFGVGGSWGSVNSNAAGLPATTGGTLPGYYTDGQQQYFAYNPTTGTVIANGIHWRVSPQAYYYYGPFGLLGEYAISTQTVKKGPVSTDVQNTAWQVSAGWVLTGEDASYTGLTPKHPFDPLSGQWGAFQLVARYAELDIDNDVFPVFSNPVNSASAAHAWAVGLNWYLNRNLRVNTSFSHTTFTGGGGGGTATTPPGIVTRQPEQVFFSRVQLYF